MDLIFLQEAAKSGGSGTMIMLALMFVVMYFFMIRPQMKKNKLQQAFRSEIKKGDKIVTNGGIHGKIAEIRDQVFIIDTEGGGKLKVEQSAISMETSNAANGKGAAKPKK